MSPCFRPEKPGRYDSIVDVASETLWRDSPGARAVIFDIDGTIVDNMHLHSEAFGVPPSATGFRPSRLTTAPVSTAGAQRNLPILFKREVERDEWLHEEEKEGLYHGLARGWLMPD